MLMTLFLQTVIIMTSFSQKKYALDILEETGLMNSKFVNIPMDPNAKLLLNQGESLSNPEVEKISWKFKLSYCC